MDNRKNDRYYLRKVIEDLAFVYQNTKEICLEEFEKNAILLDSVMFRLIQVSENADRLSDEFKAGCIDIPWRAIKGLRNRIVHEYGSVDLSIIYDTVKHDIPELLDLLEQI